jgi:hypothetical protein
MAVESLNRIWDQRWAMINSLQLLDAKRAPRHTAGHHKNTMRSTTKNNRRRRGDNANNSARRPLPKRGQGQPWNLHPVESSNLHTVIMVGGVETPCHTRLPSLNYAGSNVQPSVITHSLTVCASESCAWPAAVWASITYFTLFRNNVVPQEILVTGSRMHDNKLSSRKYDIAWPPWKCMWWWSCSLRLLIVVVHSSSHTCIALTTKC